MAPYAGTTKSSAPHPSGGGGSTAVAIVDPYSTGCCVAREVARRGYNLIAVWSDSITPDLRRHVPSNCSDLFYYAEVDRRRYSGLAQLTRAVRKATPFEVVAVMCGGDTGVALTDALSEEMGLRTNGTAVLTAAKAAAPRSRRDRKLQHDLIRAARLRHVRQAAGTALENLEPFLSSDETSYPIVVKLSESRISSGGCGADAGGNDDGDGGALSGSNSDGDDIGLPALSPAPSSSISKLCRTPEEAREHIRRIQPPADGGAAGASAASVDVLCQEYLRGTEYVIDHVSRDGMHKTTAVWTYEKKPANGSKSVYFGRIPVDVTDSSTSSEVRDAIRYARQVLDALGVKNGPSHGEVIVTSDGGGPCLVKMNCRVHGGDGHWIPLVRALNGGYSQVDAAVDSYLDPESFRKIPDMPPSPFEAAGQEVMLVSYSKGTVKSMPGYDIIRRLPSFVSLETRVDVGLDVSYTVDLFTHVGNVVLMHRDSDVVRRDVQFIRYMEEINGLFTYETKLENLKRPRADEIFLPTIEESGIGMRRAFSLGSNHLIRHFSNDRPELRGGPLMKRMTTIDASSEIVIVVDPYSTGACIAKEIINRTYNVIALWSHNIDPNMRAHIPVSVGPNGLNYLAELTASYKLDDTVRAVRDVARNYRIVACIAGAEFGVPLADELSEHLGLRTNGTSVSRRDKRIQQELVRDAGLRSVRQAGGSDFQDVESFLRKETYPVVVKPVESAGSDGVKLCHSFEEAREHYHKLVNAQNQCGGVNASVLCQEFLRGKEYVVDHVSRDGVHKTAMVWVYDKRPANGAAFVYFGCVPVDSQSPEAKLIIPYARSVLDALGVKNGASHGEIMMTPNGPCLVEMNVRAHGGDANWMPLVRGLCGYSQVDATVDAYLDKKAFYGLPDRPPSPFRAAGQEVILVSYSRGTVESTPGFDVIRKLESFVFLETGVTVGSKVEHTTDLFTCLGSAILMHPDEKVVKKDIQKIRDMEKENKFFVYEEGTEYFLSPSDNDVIALSNLTITSDGSFPDLRSHSRSFSTDRFDILW